MIQHMERGRRSNSEAFADAFGATGQAVGQAIPQYLDALQQNKQSKQRAETLRNLTGMDVSGLSEKQQEIMLGEALKQQGKNKRLGETQNFLSQIFGDQQQPQQNFSENLMGSSNNENPDMQQSNNQGRFDPSLLPDSDIAQVASMYPELGRLLQQQKDVGLREKREEKKIESKKQEVLRKETFPVRTEIAEKAEIARRGIENKKNLMNLIKTNKIDDPSFVALMEQLPFNLGQRMLSPETVEYRAGLVDNYADLKNLFTGTTRVKEIEILEKKIADLYLTDEQKERILSSRIEAHKADLVMAEAAEELEESGKQYGILQFRKEVLKKAKPKLEALSQKVIEDQSAIIKEAENRRNIPLDPNDPEDREIAEQIMKEAKGNRNQARKLAKEKGYKF